MTKPVIVTRASKGSPLTRTELDNNFTNIDNATIAVTGDTGTITNSLNDSFQISGGVATTSKVVSGALIIDLDNTAVTPGSYTLASITVDQQGRITSASNGSGSNGMTSFTAAGDTGTSQTIGDGNTLTIAGGTGLSSVASATDTITINLDDTAVTAASYTYASITVDAQGRITSASNGATPLTSGGALGTPSSGTVTNLTGTASININGTVGATTASTGAFTTLTTSGQTTLSPSSGGNVNISPTAGGTLVVAPTTAGTINNMSIGLSTAAAGRFTTLTATTAVTLSPTGSAVDISPGSTVTISPTGASGSVSIAPATTLTLNPATASTINNMSIGATTSSTGAFTGLTAKGATNTAKLTLDTTAVSSTAWTTNGIGLKVQASTFTDTSSTAGAVTASHVHVISTPTMASTNAITVNDAATLYIAAVPTSGTNTTITNKYALLVGGKIRTTGDMSVDGSLNANTGGSFGTLTTNGSVDFQATGSLAQEVRFRDNDNSNYVGFKAPATITANKIWVLPSADATVSGQALTSDASGTLSWTTLLSSGGALGTPSSGTVTNLTGTASININGTVGATTPTTGAFTSISSSTSTTIKDLRETIATVTYAATITPNVANGTVQKVTLTGNVTFSAFGTPVTGQSLTLIITQDATGSRTLTSTMKFSGASKTLSTAANAIDIMTVFYDGTNYYASLAKGFA